MNYSNNTILSFQKKLIIVSVFLSFYMSSFIVILANAQMINDKNSDENLLFENVFYKIKINYPKEWMIEDESNSKLLQIKIFPNKGDQYPKVLIEAIKLNDNNISIEKYFQEKLNKFNKDLLNFRIIEKIPYVLGNNEGQKVTFSYKLNNVAYERTEVGLIKENTIYSVSYIARESQYLQYLSEALSIINSFSFI